MIEALNQFLAGKEYKAKDVFMGVHNFHKLIVKDIAVKWHPEIPAKQTVHMADQTFRRAMKELRDQAG
jgi:hypothetical protein